MERWELLNKNESSFLVSDRGNILRLKEGKWIEAKFRLFGGHAGDRYLSVGDKQKTYYIHRLVTEAFIGPIPKDMQINHKDGDKHNNDFGNLEIVTQKENMQHAREIGLYNSEPRKKTFYIIDTDNKEVVAEFYSENSMASFLFCIGSEILGTTNKSLLKDFTKEKYEIVRTIYITNMEELK